ncbi:MAG: polyprenol monophosphomannose synthase [Candidatus Omnitrophica bacterium]|nr:polyprenol monophosphomannose synthase [Candidatus Omnitrophota bacterium]
MEHLEGKIIIIIPTFNEAENIPVLIKEVFSLDLNYSLLVIDDNSPDGTSQIVRKMQEIFPLLFLVTRKEKLGLGSAYVDGFKYALEKGYNIIVQMDADLSHDPECLPAMLDLLKNSDLVIGSRYVKRGGVCNWVLGRSVMSRAGNIFAKTMLGFSINDSTSGFKVVKRKVLEAIDFKTLTSRGYSFQIEMVYRAFLKGFKIIEYPIIFRGRKNERSKMSLGIFIEAFFRVIFWSFSKSLSSFKNRIN